MQTRVIPTDAPIVDGPPQGHWTVADWEKLPDDGNRYEIIEGYVYMSTAPTYFHQFIIKRLYRFWGLLVEEAGLAHTDWSPLGVFMPGCDPVQPDFVVVLKANEHIIHDRRIYGVPDLIVEVLSPGNATYDETTKLTAYANAAVPEYALINPATRTLALRHLVEPGRYESLATYRESDILTFQCVPSIPLVLAKLFTDAPDTTL